MTTPNNLSSTIARLDKDFSDYRAELDDRVEAVRYNHQAKLDEIEIAIAKSSLPPYGAAGVTARPGQLLNGVLDALGRGPGTSARSPDGSVSLPWSALGGRPQAALTTADVIRTDTDFTGLTGLRGASVLGDPRLAALIVELDSGAGELRLPIGSGSSAGWRSDGEALPDLGLASTALSLSAHRAGATFPLSASVLAMADTMAAESLIRLDMTQAIGEAIDAAILADSPTSNGPVGLSGVSAATVTGANGEAISVDLLDEQLTEVEAAKGKPTCFVMHPSVGRKLSRIPTLTGGNRPVLDLDSAAPRLRGVPVVFSTTASVAKTKGTSSTLAEVVVGDFSQLAVVLWGGVQIETGHAADDFSKSQISLRVQAFCDIQPLRATAFSRISHYVI